MAVTINDVATAAGVSKGAVSLALNGQPGLATATRDRIVEAAKNLGYAPSMRAKGLSSSKAYALGLVIARSPKLLGNDPFFPAFIAGIETTLAQHDYTLMLSMASDSESEERAYRKLADGKRVDGVILTDVRNSDSRIPLIEELGLPAVTLNRPETPSPFPAVCMDDTDGISAAVTHLVGLGHKRIAHVGGDQSYIHGRSRRRAWEQQLIAEGLPHGLFIEADFTAQGGMAATAELLASADPPTAIVYANDLMAMSGIAYAQSHGLTVPKDLSVVGYDDVEFSQYLNPPLTTISTDPLAWGRSAADTLLELLSGSFDGNDVILAPPRLIVRASTGPTHL